MKDNEMKLKLPQKKDKLNLLFLFAGVISEVIRM